MYTKYEVNENGIENTFAGKIVGHHILVHELESQNMIKDDLTVLVVGSETARGDLTGFALPDMEATVSLFLVLRFSC
jgi:hypothetical protein